MILIEYFPCKTRRELEHIEQFWISDLKPTLNTNYAVREKPQYYLDNKEYFTNKHKTYYEEHKEELNTERSEVIKCPCGKDYTYGHRLRHFKSDRHRRYDDPEYNKQRLQEEKEQIEKTTLNDLANKKRYYQENKETLKEYKSKVMLCECGVQYTQSNKSTHMKSQLHKKQLEPIPADKVRCECGYIVRGGKWLDKHQTSKQHNRDMERLPSIYVYGS